MRRYYTPNRQIMQPFGPIKGDFPNAAACAAGKRRIKQKHGTNEHSLHPVEAMELSKLPQGKDGGSHDRCLQYLKGCGRGDKRVKGKQQATK